MALIKPLRGFTPVIGENTFLAENATIIGDVTIGRDCSIWFSTVLRGDVNKITIGDRVNIQDGVVVHTLYQRSVTVIGNDHLDRPQRQHSRRQDRGQMPDRHGSDRARSCRRRHGIDRRGQFAGTVENRYRTGSVYAGVPARRVKDVTPEQVRDIIERTARDYMMYASWYK